jgi:2-polyprenyl-3-methyl-5-hydroxy-6-metoxy-1,4-benzoquinol methylase
MRRPAPPRARTSGAATSKSVHRAGLLAPVAAPPSRFDYTAIPAGHYDRVLRQGSGIRRLWHLSKFERVLDYLPRHGGQAILDIGCFAGTFLSMAEPERFSRQLGVDILPAQVAYANAQYGTAFRRFEHVESITHLSGLDERFDCVTLIEVIEHLTPGEIRELLGHVARLLNPGGKLVLTTPNYASAWPILEQILNRVGDVSYEEQHITRFTFFDVERRLAEIYPRLNAAFELEMKTTTHLVTPFLAWLSFDVAHRLSRMVPHARWRLPFGNLVLVALVRR